MSKNFTAAAAAAAGLAAVSYWLLARRRRAGAGSEPSPEVVSRCSATVLAPAAELYRLWRDPRERARFGAQAEPEFLEQEPPHQLSWRLVRRHSPFLIQCHLRLQPRASESADTAEVTEVHLQTRITLAVAVRKMAVPPRLAARLVRGASAHAARYQALHLYRMKQLAETGEISTIAGQPSGRRSLIVRRFQPLDRPATALQRLRGVG